MPPKKEQDLDDFVVSDDDDSDMDSPPPKKSGAKATPKAGAKAAPKAGAKRGVGGAKEADADTAKAKKPKPAPPPKDTTVDENGWTMDPPSLIFKDFGSKPSKKIAGFDLDGTLVETKSGAQFPVSANDWKFAFANVPQVLKKFHKDGYRIVIFTNQGGIKKALAGAAASTAKGKVDGMLSKAGVPALVLMATLKDELRKPGRGMWERMVGMNGGVEPDLVSSFYCGDAAGRPTDFMDRETGAPADTDKQFAGAVGVAFKVPESMFTKGQAAGGEGNDAIIGIFSELAEHFKTSGGDKDGFKAAAYRKVVDALMTFEPKITEGNLKQVLALKGVGKGSLGIIEEYLKTGKVADLEAIREAKGGGVLKADAAAKEQPTGPKNANAAVAFKFM